VLAADARQIALVLFEDYLFAFEVLGVLLLAAVIGGLYLAKRDDDMPETNNARQVVRDKEEGA
jgi:multidrug resistance efflux pump